jgi:hypothetical protein
MTHGRDSRRIVKLNRGKTHAESSSRIRCLPAPAKGTTELLQRRMLMSLDDLRAFMPRLLSRPGYAELLAMALGLDLRHRTSYHTRLGYMET